MVASEWKVILSTVAIKWRMSMHTARLARPGVVSSIRKDLSRVEELQMSSKTYRKLCRWFTMISELVVFALCTHFPSKKHRRWQIITKCLIFELL